MTKENDKRTDNDIQNTTQKLNIEQHEPHLKPVLHSGAPEEKTVIVPITCRVILVTNPVISHEGEKDREVLTRSGIYSIYMINRLRYI